MKPEIQIELESVKPDAVERLRRALAGEEPGDESAEPASWPDPYRASGKMHSF